VGSSVHGEQLSSVATVNGEVQVEEDGEQPAAWLAVHDGAAEEITARWATVAGLGRPRRRAR
jgi:hypothetical protein